MRRHLLASVAFLVVAVGALGMGQAQAKEWSFPWAPGPQGNWFTGAPPVGAPDDDGESKDGSNGATEENGSNGGGNSGGDTGGDEQSSDTDDGSDGGDSGNSGGNEQSANNDGGAGDEGPGPGDEGPGTGDEGTGADDSGGSDEGSGSGSTIILTENDHSFDQDIPTETDEPNDNPNGPPNRISVPEPSGLALLAGALLSYAGVRRRKRPAK